MEYFLKKQNLTNIKHYSIKTIINRYIQHTCLCFFLKCLCYSLILTSTVIKSAFRKPKTNVHLFSSSRLIKKHSLWVGNS